MSKGFIISFSTYLAAAVAIGTVLTPSPMLVPSRASLGRTCGSKGGFGGWSRKLVCAMNSSSRLLSASAKGFASEDPPALRWGERRGDRREGDASDSQYSSQRSEGVAWWVGVGETELNAPGGVAALAGDIGGEDGTSTVRRRVFCSPIRLMTPSRRVSSSRCISRSTDIIACAAALSSAGLLPSCRSTRARRPTTRRSSPLTPRCSARSRA